MSTSKKVILVCFIVLIAGGVWGAVLHQRASVIRVTSAKVLRQDLISVVSGTGQIKPKTYVNVGATAFGRITNLNVKEGDHVKRGATLATVENVQA